jgi:hypothetical protein
VYRDDVVPPGLQFLGDQPWVHLIQQ